MSTYTATIRWERGDQLFTDNRYSRGHKWFFDGAVEVPGSSSPHIVPLPYSRPNAVDPEEAFVASLSSCHMLWFLSIAANRGFCVDSYVDDAEGIMARNTSGKLAMTRVTLRPRAVFVGNMLPTPSDIASMHHKAHAECFIANSVKTEVHCEPVHDPDPAFSASLTRRAFGRAGGAGRTLPSDPMNDADARSTLVSCLARYRRMSYGELASLIGALETGEVEGEGGTKYQFEVGVYWDDPDQPHDAIRVFGSIDEGGIRAYAPVCETFLIAPDGTIVDE
jgi:organic hydroperoxide reductase OsmC/OhrA